MSLTPPAGSTIMVTTDGSDPVVTIPAGSGGVSRFFMAAFLLFWLGGWIIGGGFVAFFLYRLLRPSISETLRLGINDVAYDSGIPPFRANYYYSSGMRSYGWRKDQWAAMFPKRTVAMIDRRQIQTLRLRDTDDGNRLTVDAGAQRLDLGCEASEVEREWLYRVLADKYGVAAPTDGLNTGR